MSGIFIIEEFEKVEENIVFCEVGLVCVIGVVFNVDVWVVLVVLGGSEDDEVKNFLSFVEVLE